MVSGGAGLELSDSVVVSVGGDGVTFAEGTANKIVLSAIGTGRQAASAVRVTSAGTSPDPKALTLDSTLLTGGAAGLAVNTGGGATSTAGDVDVILRHVTAAGSTNGLVLDASQASPALGGSFGRSGPLHRADRPGRRRVRRSIKLGAGVYRVAAAGLDNSGVFGNSAALKNRVHRFRPTK